MYRRNKNLYVCSKTATLRSHLLTRYFVGYNTPETLVKPQRKTSYDATPLHLLQIQNTVNNHQIPMNPMVPDALRQREVRIVQTRQSN